jgi:hypothetical protein
MCQGWHASVSAEGEELTVKAASPTYRARGAVCRLWTASASRSERVTGWLPAIALLAAFAAARGDIEERSATGAEAAGVWRTGVGMAVPFSVRRIDSHPEAIPVNTVTNQSVNLTN